MSTQCYAMVRGSAIRVTRLDEFGSTHGPIDFATSRSASKVQINESVETASNESMGSDTDDNEIRLRFHRPAQTLRYTADIDFLRVDPGVLSIVAGVPLVYKGSSGFGYEPFGESPFGGDLSSAAEVVGFDSDTRKPASSFALEVWSKLAGNVCEDGTRLWGYTVLPFLRGGYLSGFAFADGLVSFNLLGAQTRKSSRWGVGPYDLEGYHERLLEVVSGNTMFKSFITPAQPPVEVCGIQETIDLIDGGYAVGT